MTISCDLVAWYHLNKREMPWRNTRDPYKIWLSEIILQQTRVEQGTPYYYRFINEFPTVSDLANASEEQVLKLWQGLGYYSRARNLQKAAKMVMEAFNGEFPTDFQDIIKLPGIGEYTASAISSFAYDQNYAVLDGNVYRVLSRLFNINTPINSTLAKKIFNELALKILDKKDPATHNQAIMEFGATYCKPANPNCHQCVLATQCAAFIADVVKERPVKLKKNTILKRYFNYLLIRHREDVFINKRNGSGIWQNLYELPVIETFEDHTEKSVISSHEWITMFRKQKHIIKFISPQKVHKLSHQHIYYRTIEIKVPDDVIFEFHNSYLKIPAQQAENYPVPKIIENIFRENFEKLYAK